MAVAAAAFALTLATTPIVMSALRRSGVVDNAGARSSHQGSVVRGGGIAVVAAVALVVGVASRSELDVIAPLLFLVVGSSVFGLADDLRGDIPWQLRLAGSAVVVAISIVWLIAVTPASGLAWLLLAVAILGYINAFNFMDGINGISALSAAASAAVLAWVGSTEHVEVMRDAALAALGACLAFVPFNFPRARIFLGDVGSYGLGALLAGIASLGVLSGAPAVACIGAFAPYVADVAFTLVRRWRRDAVLHEAHRDHAYQQLADRTGGHAVPALSVAALTATCGVLGVLASKAKPPAAIAAGATICGLCAVYALTPWRRIAE